MGSLFSSTAAPSASTELQTYRGLSKQQLVHICIQGNNTDFYELFQLERYADVSSTQVYRAFRREAPNFHPDAYRGDDEEERLLRGHIFRALVVAKETLTDRKKKAAYDRELKVRRGEMSRPWSYLDWLVNDNPRLLTSAALVVLGLGLGIGLSFVTCGVGGAIAIAAVTGAVSGAGIRGTALAVKSPDMPLEDFLTQCGGAALVGAATSAAMAPVAAALAGTKLTAEAVAQASGAAVGASKTAANAGAAVGRPVVSRVVSALMQVLGTASQLANELLTSSFDVPIFAVRERSTYYMDVSARFLGDEGQPRPMGGSRCCDLLRQKDENSIADSLEQYRGFASGACLKAYTAETLLYSELNDALMDVSVVDLVFHSAYLHNLKYEMKLRGAERGWAIEGKLWRGAEIPASQTAMWTTVGSKFLNASFMSTSRLRSEAERRRQDTNRNALLQIDVAGNMGARGLTYAVDIRDVSRFPTEEEVLIYPFSGFEVVHSSKTHGVWHVTLRVLDTEHVENHYRCCAGHKLEDFTTPLAGSHVCDRCNAVQPKGSVMQSCRPCNYDVCATCMGKLWQAGVV